MWWILSWVRGVQVVPCGPWGLISASHQACVSGMCPVMMRFPAGAAQGIIVGTHPELSAQFFLCPPSDSFYLSFQDSGLRNI